MTFSNFFLFLPQDMDIWIWFQSSLTKFKTKDPSSEKSKKPFPAV